MKTFAIQVDYVDKEGKQTAPYYLESADASDVLKELITVIGFWLAMDWEPTPESVEKIYNVPDEFSDEAFLSMSGIAALGFSNTVTMTITTSIKEK